MRGIKQWICNFIVLFAIILGMCTFEIGADSVFVCDEVATSCIESVYEIRSVADMQNTEALCSYNITVDSRIAAQNTNSRKVIRPFLNYLWVAAIFFLLSKFYQTERVAEFKGLLSRTVVLDFIHNADGKK